MTVDFSLLRKLYDEARFIDAYNSVDKAVWNDKRFLNSLDDRELCLAGRLALRLGSRTRQSIIYRTAKRRFPDSPFVRYYIGDYWGKKSVYETLRDYEKMPELNTEDADVNASYLACQAYLWGRMRDFKRAYELIEKAKTVCPDHSYIHTCEADLLMDEDRCEEALAMAELSWKESHGAPFAATRLGEAMERLHSPAEIYERFASELEKTQSYEIIEAAMTYLVAAAERNELKREFYISIFDKLEKKVLELAPLADRQLYDNLRIRKLDIALMKRDTQAIGTLNIHNKYVFYNSVLKNFKANPEGLSVRISHTPMRQNKNECLPFSISVVLSHFGATFDIEAMVRELTFNGTYQGDAAEWLRERGFKVRCMILSEPLMKKLLLAGIPFVFSRNSDFSSHAMAATGFDDAMNLIIYCDPGSMRYGIRIFEGICEDDAPLGPFGMLVVPAGKEALFELVPDDAYSPCENYWRYHKLLRDSGSTAALSAVEAQEKAFPDQLFSFYLRACYYNDRGDYKEAIPLLEKIIKEFPSCPTAIDAYLRSLRNTAHASEILEIVRKMLEEGKIPTIETKEKSSWRYAKLRCLYADYLRIVKSDFDEAEKQVNQALDSRPYDAEPYHILGDIMAGRLYNAEKLLPLRLAALLDDSDNHYVDTYVRALLENGLTVEAASFMAALASDKGTHKRGASLGCDYIDFLENYSFFKEACAEAERFLTIHSESPGYLSFYLAFKLRCGEIDKAQEILNKLEKLSRPESFLPAAYRFYSTCGNWKAALEPAEKWFAESPDSSSAASALFNSVSYLYGQKAAVDRVAGLLDSAPDNLSYQELYYDYLSDAALTEKKWALLEKRLNSFPEDSWALPRYALMLIDKVHALEASEERNILLEKVSTISKHLLEIQPDSAIVHVVHGRCLLLQPDKYEEAAEAFFKAIDLAPAYSYALSQLRATVDMMGEGRFEILEKLDSFIRASRLNCQAVDEVSITFVRYAGIDEAVKKLDEWRALHRNDSRILEALAERLYESGRESDLQRIISLLNNPEFTPLERMKYANRLAWTYKKIGNLKEAYNLASEMYKKDPASSTLRSLLATLLREKGEGDASLKIYEAAYLQAPAMSSCITGYADELCKSGKQENAIDILRELLESDPYAVSGTRNKLVDIYKEAQREDDAVALFEKIREYYPNWAGLRIGELRSEFAKGVFSPAAEEAFQSVLKIDCEDFDVVDSLAYEYSKDKRFDEAHALIDKYIGRNLSGRFYAEGRKADLFKREGRVIDALHLLKQLLYRHPYYVYGRDMIISILEENRSKGIVSEMLPERLPPQLLTDVEFRYKRMLLLDEYSILPREQSDAEWDTLIKDFPVWPQRMHQLRYDKLWEAGRRDEAKEIINSIYKKDPANAYVIARRLEYMAEEKRRLLIPAVVMEIWNVPTLNYDEWPMDFSWKTLDRLNMTDFVVDKYIKEQSKAGKLMPLAVLYKICKFVEQKYPFTKNIWNDLKLDKIYHERGTRILDALLKHVQKHPAASSSHYSYIFDSYVSTQRSDLVLAFWRKNKEFCSSSDELWGDVGRAMCSASKHDLARSFMADWRDRKQIESWMLVNYMWSLFKYKDKEYDKMRKALEEFEAVFERIGPNDYYSIMTVIYICAICIDLKDYNRLLDCSSKYMGILERPLTDNDSSTEYYKNLLKYILMQRAMLMTDNQNELSAHEAAFYKSFDSTLIGQFKNSWIPLLRHKKRPLPSILKAHWRCHGFTLMAWTGAVIVLFIIWLFIVSIGVDGVTGLISVCIHGFVILGLILTAKKFRRLA